MEDHLIIDLYFERNERAIIESERKYGRYCFSIANNILSNEYDSEECVNDTWNKAWNAIPPQKPNNFKLFLAKISRNLAISRLRAQGREKRGSGSLPIVLDEISEIISDGDSVEKELQDKEFMASVNKFLRGLSERDCNIFIRRYFFLESHEVIAEKHGLRVANVGKILSRIRAKLRVFLKKEGYIV